MKRSRMLVSFRGVNCWVSLSHVSVRDEAPPFSQAAQTLDTINT